MSSPTATPAHACLACGRHPSTHAPANADSDDACPMCGLGDEHEAPRNQPLATLTRCAWSTAATGPCHAPASPPAVYYVTLRLYDGGSDEYGRPEAFQRGHEVCAPTPAVAERRARALYDCDVLAAETEPTFDACHGNGRATCLRDAE